MSEDIESRITAYLSAGGLFNPELMEHEKVRDLLMDCREQLAAEREKVKQLQSQLEHTEEWDDQHGDN